MKKCLLEIVSVICVITCLNGQTDSKLLFILHFQNSTLSFYILMDEEVYNESYQKNEIQLTFIYMAPDSQQLSSDRAAILNGCICHFKKMIVNLSRLIFHTQHLQARSSALYKTRA